MSVRLCRAEVGEVRGLAGRVAAAEDGRGGHAGGPVHYEQTVRPFVCGCTGSL